MALSTIQNNSFANTAVHGFRNLLVNGGLIVSQRGDYTSATSYTGENYYLDRWKMWISGVTGTVQQTTVTINGVTKKAMKIAATSSGTGYIGTRQIIELQNIPVGVNLVASCWVRSNNSYTRFRQNDFGGSDSNSPVFTNDGNWEKVSFSIDSSSTTVNPSIGIITFDTSTVSVTSGDYIEFTDVQLEISSGSPTPFEHRSYGDELQRCQRYCTVLNSPSNLFMYRDYYSTDTMVTNADLPVTMRTTPSITMTGSGGTSNTGFTYINLGAEPTLAALSPQAIAVYRGVASSARTYIHMASTGELTMEAEL